MSSPHIHTMNDEGLLECPFCGDSETLIDKCDGLYQVVCIECGISTDSYMKKNLLIKKWNTRNGHLYTKDDFAEKSWEMQNSDLTGGV